MIIYETYYGVDALHMPKAGKRNVFTNQPFSDYIRLLKTRKNQNGEPFEIPLLESGEEWPVSSNRVCFIFCTLLYK